MYLSGPEVIHEHSSKHRKRINYLEEKLGQSHFIMAIKVSLYFIIFKHLIVLAQASHIFVIIKI